MSVLKYTEHYDRTWQRLMEKQGQFPLEEYGDRSLLTTWIMSYEQVRRHSEGAASLLKLWGFLDCGELWYKLLAAGAQLEEELLITLPTGLIDIMEDELEFADTVGLFLRYSLADATEGTDSYSMHSVPHKWCGQLVDGPAKYAFGLIATGLIAHSVSKARTSFEKRGRLLAHTEYISAWMEETPFDNILGASETFTSIEAVVPANFFHIIGSLLRDHGRLDEAKTMFEKELRIYEKKLQSPDLIIVYKQYENILRTKEEIFGPEHASIHSASSQLAFFYEVQGRLDEADVLYEQVKQQTGKSTKADTSSAPDKHGWELPGKDIVKEIEYESISNSLEELDGDNTELGSMLRSATWISFTGRLVKIFTEMLSTFISLGSVYKSQNRLDNAERIYKRALRGHEMIPNLPNPEHFYDITFTTMDELGQTYVEQNRPDEAKNMYEQALQIYEKNSTVEFQPTPYILEKLGDIYTGWGQLDQAEKMYIQALRGHEEAQGPDDISTSTACYKLARYYRNHQKQLDKVEELYIRALQGFETFLGPDNITLIHTVEELGGVYMEQGQLDKAVIIYKRALQGHEEAYGPKGLSTLGLIYKLAFCYSIIQGQLDEAEILFKDAIHRYKSGVSPEGLSTHHPALCVMWGLGRVLALQNRIEDARAFFSEALSGYKRVVRNDGLKYQLLEDLRHSLANLEKINTRLTHQTKKIRYRKLPTKLLPILVNGKSKRYLKRTKCCPYKYFTSSQQHNDILFPLPPFCSRCFYGIGSKYVMEVFRIPFDCPLCP